MSLATALPERFVRWALPRRAPEALPIVLGQRRVYILPSLAGLGYAPADIARLRQTGVV